MSISLLPRDWLTEQMAAAGQVTPFPVPEERGPSKRQKDCLEKGGKLLNGKCIPYQPAEDVQPDQVEEMTPEARECIFEKGLAWSGTFKDGQCYDPFPEPETPPSSGEEYVPPVNHPPPGDTGGTPDNTPTGGTPDNTPTGEEVAGEIRQQLPTFDPRIGQPSVFRPPSVADVLADPRYRMAERELDKQMKAQAAATGTRGAPLLAARSRAKQGLLGDMMGQLYGQGLQSWQAGLQHGQDTHNRFAAQHNRATVPLQMGYSHALGLAGHGLGQQQLGLGQQQLAWQREWLPQQQQNLFNQQRWLTGQNNAMSLYMAMLGMRAPGLEQRT